jgi:hypothetical protein
MHRLPAKIVGLIVLAGCSSPAPADSTRLSLNNPYWDRVNVQLVVTRNSDCDKRGDGYLASREFVMPRNQIEVIDVPNGATVCWRRDRNPDNPAAGVWTGWTKATLPPGRSAEADL